MYAYTLVTIILIIEIGPNAIVL